MSQATTEAPRQGKILRIRETEGITGMHRATIWRWERDGKFPHRVQISEKCVGHFEDEVRDWLRSRPRKGGTSLTPKPAA